MGRTLVRTNICSQIQTLVRTNTRSQAHELGHVPRDPTHIHRYMRFVWSHSRKKRQKKDGLLGLFLVAGGVGFLWVGLCFVVGKPLAARQPVFGCLTERGVCFPPRFTPC